MAIHICVLLTWCAYAVRAQEEFEQRLLRPDPPQTAAAALGLQETSGDVEAAVPDTTSDSMPGDSALHGTI